MFRGDGLTQEDVISVQGLCDGVINGLEVLEHICLLDPSHGQSHNYYAFIKYLARVLQFIG